MIALPAHLVHITINGKSFVQSCQQRITFKTSLTGLCFGYRLSAKG